MPLPPLPDWPATARGLHLAAQLLGAVRLRVRDPEPHTLELALRIEPGGLSSDRLPGGGSLLLDLRDPALVYRDGGGEPAPIALRGHSQASLLEALLALLDERGAVPAPPADGTRTGGFRAALRVRGHALAGSLELTAAERLEVDPRTSAAYAAALERVFTAIARWRARLVGYQTPVVVWPEHFDLSTLWFPGGSATEAAPHMNFGFAPFDAVHSHPYLYAYAHPMPGGFATLPLPPGAHWIATPWKGLVVPYEVLAAADDPGAAIEGYCAAAAHALSPAPLDAAVRSA